MQRSLPLFKILFVLVLLSLGNAEMGPMTSAAAKICESESRKFKGICESQSICASVCMTEGFKGGKCRGSLSRCFCSKLC